MKKVAIVFVLAVIAPSLVLAWLAVRALWGVPRPSPRADPGQR